MSTLQQCEKLFGTRDIYELLQITKDASPKDIKKAYYNLSLKVHPDRVSDDEKKEATEKFKVLSKIYQVLSDKDKKKTFDEQGIIDDEDIENVLSNWLEVWRKIFKPIEMEDIINYEKSYVGSDGEIADIKKAYLSSKGCINQMMNKIPFLKVEDEPRLHEIVNKLIADNEVPEYKIFTNEPAQKRDRRHKKYAQESKEAEKIKKKINAKFGSLEQQMLEKRKERESSFGSLIDRLTQKYANGEDVSDEIQLNALVKKKVNKKNTAQNKVKQQTNNIDEKLHEVKTGKVTKRNRK